MELVMRFIDGRVLAFTSLLLVAPTGCGGDDGQAAGGTPDGGGAGEPDAGGGAPAFPAVSDFGGPGPFPTTPAAGVAEGPDCTVFRPEPLGAGGVRHPVLVWGNGTFTTPAAYAIVLNHWASHGFVVVAANTSNAGTGNEMLACLDYVIGENARAGSVYEGKIDALHVGTSGHSQGGGGALMLGRDPRVVATAPLQPFTIGLSHDVASQSQQHGPMFLMSGTADTWAAPQANQKPVFDNANVPVFWATKEGADHLADGTNAIEKYRAPATAWLRLHLMGDETARSLFYGASCGLCTDPTWAVQKKGIE